MPNEQLKMTFSAQRGAALKESGKDLVETTNAAFVAKMREEAERVAATTGQVCADDLRRYAIELGIKPEHPNAWGSIFRGKRWRCVGRTTSKLASNHAREIRVWATN